nr:hypothetical protein [Mycobacterium senriense]
MISQFAGPNGTVCRPDPGNPTTLSAQVPSPSSSRMKVPKNSASMAPGSPARSLVIAEAVIRVCPGRVVDVDSTWFPTRPAV